LLLKIRL